MAKIKITTSFPEFPLCRQTPQSSCSWNNCSFYLNQDIKECDFWVVYEDLLETEGCECLQENTIFVTGEPPTIKYYSPEFLQQFGMIVTFRRDIHHNNIALTQCALPWHVGRRVRGNGLISYTKDFDELMGINSFLKDKLISVIVSAKDFTEGHRKRLKFLLYLINHFRARIHVFGKGILDIEDKWDGIAPYKYHIVMENCSYPHYFTEKLSDAFLAGAYPFYYGASNLSDYFPKESFTSIDIENPIEAVETIEKQIIENRYEKTLPKIWESRNLILTKYNLFPLICEMVKNRPANKQKTTIRLQPAKYFT